MSRIVIAVLCLAVLGLGFMQYRTVSTLHATESQLKATVEADQAKTRDMINAEIAKIRDASAADAAAREKALNEMRDEMDKAKRQASGVAGRVRREAMKSVDDLSSRVEANEKKIRDQQAVVAAELGDVKQANTTAETKIAAVSTEVRDVRTDVANTRTQLDRTISDLHRMTGDMGVMSGLIATNGKEIAALKLLGDRNYTEFSIQRNKQPVQVGDVWVILKKADVNRSRFTLELRADDQKIEKKDRTANEPVQFYVGRNKQPHELVVNQVSKDRVIGYLATPKAGALRP